jgi:hypothetical protein
MRKIPSKLIRSAGVLCGVAFAAAAFGQAPIPVRYAVHEEPRPAAKPAVGDNGAAHKMEVYQGPNRTVYYFAGSPGEQSMLHDLQRAENEMAYLDDLQALRRQYVTSERTLEPQRLYVQEQLYGTSISYSRYDALSGYGYGFGSGYAYPYAYAYPYSYGSYGYPGFGGGSLGASSNSVTRNLAYGMGDEGCLKNTLATAIAQQALSPEYYQAVSRGYQAALGRVASTPSLAKALHIDKKDIGEAAGPPDAQPPKPGTSLVTTKTGDRIEGKLTEDGDWYVIDTGKTETRVRKSEVIRIDKVK